MSAELSSQFHKNINETKGISDTCLGTATTYLNFPIYCCIVQYEELDALFPAPFFYNSPISAHQLHAASLEKTIHSSVSPDWEDNLQKYFYLSVRAIY